MKILITGATSGLGYALSQALSKRGHIVYAASKNKKEAYFLEKKSKDDKIILFPVVLNITAEKDISLIDKLDIDVLVLHAGTCEGGNLLSLDLDKMKENYEVNIFGNLRLIQKYAKERENNKKTGKIFVTSSLLAHIPFPYLGSYGSSKASLSYCVETLQWEILIKHKDLHLTLVEPGAFHTGFNQVMIDNQEINQHEVTSLDKKVSRVDSLLFIFLESFTYDSFVDKLVQEIEKENPKKRIRMPRRQSVGLKILEFFSLFK